MRAKALTTLALMAVPALLLLVPNESQAGKRKVSRPLVSFHLEAQKDDRPKKTTRVIIGTETFRLRLASEFDQNDLEGYFPFLADDGLTMGAAFKLKPSAAKRLLALSQKRVGSKLFTVAGSDVIHYVLLNGPVDDGYIVCWKGLKLEHLDGIKAAGIPQIRPESGGGGDDPAYEPELPSR